MLLGTNDNPAHRVPLSTIVASKSRFVRWPLIGRRDYRRRVANLQARGIEPVLILTNQWLTAREKAEKRYGWIPATHRAKRTYPTVRYWQVGNECDNVGESSETRTAADYSDMLAQCSAAMSIWSDFRRTIISAGAANGSPDYWDDVDLSPADVFAVHMATQTPETVGARLALYERFGKPLWITEWYSEHLAFNSEEERAEDMSKMILAMAAGGAEAAIFYALSDRQFDGGLVDVHNAPYPSFAAFADANA